MERLTFEGNFCDIAKCEGYPGCTFECPNGFCKHRRVWERLKEYEDAEQAGLLKAIPCKVGDTVYVINRRLSAVFECTVISVHVGHSSDSKNHIKTRWAGKNGSESIRKWSFRQIGRYVFLTKEEADAALASEVPATSEKPEEPEWKRRVMRTFLGGR